jgi:hypothetical protein
VSELVNFSSLSNRLELSSDHFSDWLCWPFSIKKDPPVSLDGAKLLLKFIFKNNVSVTNSKI